MTTARAEWTKTTLLPPRHVYMIEPIDDWSGWMDKAALMSSLAFVDFHEHPPALTISEKIKHDLRRSKEALGDFEALAMAAARTVGWEGDIRDGPYFSALPPKAFDNYCFVAVMMALKQDNNGQTFIVSPYELPWLADDALLTGYMK